MEEILAASGPDPETDPSIEPAALKDGEVARSLKCDECGKKFRSMAQAEFHGNKTYVHVPSSFAPYLTLYESVAMTNSPSQQRRLNP